MKSKITVAIFAVIIFAGFILSVILPNGDFLVSERRYPAAFPEVSKKSIAEGTFMSSFETYSQDNFPLREALRSVKSFVSNYVLLRGENNGVYKDNGHISEYEYPINTASLERAAAKFEELKNKYFSDAENIYFSVIPDKNKYMSASLKMDYEDFENKMTDLVSFAEYIDISPYLNLEDYYRTDTHWRQEKIGDVADHLLSEMGKGGGEEYEVRELEKDFYGVYCGRWALPVSADKIYYLTNESIENLKVTNFETGETTVVYDMEKAQSYDPYEMFLSGPVSLITIENSEVSDGSHLIIFRDSFASSLAPLLSSGWEKITLIDVRYINSLYLGSFVDFEGADILFLYSTLVLNNSETLK